ncbi:MAG: helix-turn-helix transcriptional regulator [Rhizobiaceae bacterium]|nr:helix-turn-helix transcriptional regulator [Rhizobiaceae bacterium]
MVASGQTSKHIARLLDISPETVRKHRKDIYKKLDVNCVADLASLSILLGPKYTPSE